MYYHSQSSQFTFIYCKYCHFFFVSFSMIIFYLWEEGAELMMSLHYASEGLLWDIRYSKIYNYLNNFFKLNMFIKNVLSYLSYQKVPYRLSENNFLFC